MRSVGNVKVDVPSKLHKGMLVTVMMYQVRCYGDDMSKTMITLAVLTSSGLLELGFPITLGMSLFT